MLFLSATGSFDKTEKFLKKMMKGDIYKILSKYGEMGVTALASATPVSSGKTSRAWSYEISKSIGAHTITWHNSNMAGGTPVAILLQYGHATGTGGYVQGIDFINPALKPVFDKMANDVWKEVTSA